MKRIVIAIAVAVLAANSAIAASYPSATVRLLCWSSAGAPLDVMMRQVGKQLGDILNQTFIVENRPGGEGAIAMATLLNKPADGYSILSTTSSMSFAMATKDNQHTPDEFIVLPALQSEPSAIAVKGDSRFKTMKQLIEFIRSQPDKVSVGGFSSAGFHQYVFYRLQQEAGFKSIWVPFKGGQDAALALLGGHIDVAIMTPSSALSQIKNGDIRLLGISSGERNDYFPDVPTFKEQGYNVEASIWRGIMVKAGTPQPIVNTLMSALNKMKSTKEWQDFSRINMQSPVNITLDAMQKQVRDEVASDRAFLEANGFRK